jgi:hypothetical protein
MPVEEPSARSIRQTTGLVALDGILDAGTVLSIAHRPLDGAFARLAGWLDSLPREALPEGRFIAPPADVPRRLARLCAEAGLAAGPERKLLIADVAALARAFARLAGNRAVDLRLEALDHDSCWRFHRDFVGLRLNATYRGPGTQWVRPCDSARASRAQRRYAGPLQQVPRFAVALFKGVRRAGSGAILHRSPPVAGMGVNRLFLCIDEPSFD